MIAINQPNQPLMPEAVLELSVEEILPGMDISRKDPSGPTAECLVARLDQLRRFLLRKGFGEYVAERAIDRVIRAALRYLTPGSDTPTLQNRVSWLFGSALSAARQEASREGPCAYLDPMILSARFQDETDGMVAEYVHSALAQLTDPQRQAVYFCIMRGMSLAEAAAEMGCHRTTVYR